MKPKNKRLRELPISWDLTLLFQEAFREIETYGKPEERILRNYNNTLFSHPIDLSTQGYIFPSLPTPYVYISDFDNSNMHHIEIRTPVLLTDYIPEPTEPVKVKAKIKSPISRSPELVSPVKPPGGPKLKPFFPPAPIPSLR